MDEFEFQFIQIIKTWAIQVTSRGYHQDTYAVGLDRA